MSCLPTTHIRRRAGYGYLFILIILMVVSCTCHLFAQKQPVDTGMIKHWSKVLDGAVISPDGKFAVYSVLRESEAFDPSKVETTLKTISGDRSVYLGKGLWASKFFWYCQGHRWLLLNRQVLRSVTDSMKILDLNSEKITGLSGILAFKNVKDNLFLLRKNGMTQDLLLQTNLNESRVLVTKLNNRSLEQYGDNLLLKVDGQNTDSWKFLNVYTKNTRDLFSVAKGVEVMVNKGGTKFAYLKPGSDGPQAWIYDTSNGESNLLFSTQPLSTEPELMLDKIVDFSSDGKYLMFTVKPKQATILKKPAVPGLAKIWSYDSDNLSGKHDGIPSFMAIISLKDKTTKRLQYDGDNFPRIGANWVLIEHRIGDGDEKERNWNKASQSKWRLVSLITGEIRSINHLGPERPFFSPNEKYLVWFDKHKQDYWFLDLADGKLKDLLKPIKGSRLAFYNDYLEGNERPGWDLRWFNHDSLLLVKDQYNFWKIDIARNKKPIRLTGKGINDHVTFDLLELPTSLRSGDTVYMTAFDRKTKENGLYALLYGDKPTLKRMFMWPYLTYSKSFGQSVSNVGLIMEPQKASGAKVWLIARQSAQESPNLFTTTDFRNFQPLTDVHPERAYNGMTSKLYQWQGLNGEALQGILYKPEDFDPSKKYPVIFYYYEKVSDGLNGFITPELCSGPLEIPWFVSRGYLVFAPDIHYRMGHAGQSALSSVESAAQMISKLLFVNSNKMGIQGHSFGGFETNYIVTHSKRFAAAATASGINNYIADYQERGAEPFETGQHRVGYSLFDRPDLYIENSSILRLKEVNTPLLIMHTTDDSACSYAQGKALFMGLRRLGKPSWLLTYANENHSLANHKAQYDYTQKLQQFFDHYLKDMPKPDWMISNEKNKH